MIRYKKLSPTAKGPTKAHDTDLGYDLFADENVWIGRDCTVTIRTSIAIGFPKGYGGLIKDRSSMAKKGLVTSGGVIDESYIGEIAIFLTNRSQPPFPHHYIDDNELIKISKGDKIAQLVLVETTNFPILEVEELESTERGEKGFGSSGS